MTLPPSPLLTVPVVTASSASLISHLSWLLCLALNTAKYSAVLPHPLNSELSSEGILVNMNHNQGEGAHNDLLAMVKDRIRKLEINLLSLLDATSALGVDLHSSIALFQNQSDEIVVEEDIYTKICN